METTEERVLKQINEEIGEYKKPITVSTGWEFKQEDAINQAILYTNGKYIDGDVDTDDLKLYFYNIIRAANGTTTKAIDLDTKDIIIKNAPGGDWLKAWFYQRDLKYWLKKDEFGKTLNRISRELPQFGSVVIKYHKGKSYFVNLKNFIVEQNADCLDFSNYIIEQHFFTPMEFKKIAKEQGWDSEKVKKIIEEYRKSNDQYIRVFERYGELENDDGDYDYKKIIFADIPHNIKNNQQQNIETFSGELLFEDMVTRHPYQEFHINKIPGRWLGVGIPELLSENQIRINEIINQQVKSSYFNTLRLWQGRDSGVARNLLAEAENGDVLNVNEFIQPVDMQDRNLSHFLNETELWERNAQAQTFTTDIMRGERTPAGTPLGSAQLSTAQAISFFDQIREDYSLELKSFIWNFVIPGLSEEMNKEHMVKIAGEDIDKLAELVSNVNVKYKTLQKVLDTGRLPDVNGLEVLKIISERETKGKGEIQLTVPKDWYKDAKYEIEIDITGESESAAVKAQALITTLQAITTDPTILQDPTKKRIFSKYLEQVGVSLADLESNIPVSTRAEIPQVPMAGTVGVSGAGGGISAPVETQGTINETRI